MGRRRFAYSWLLLGLVACDEVVAPDTSPFEDILALQVSAAPVDPPFRTDSTARFKYVVRNPLAREVVIWGNHCLYQLEVQDPDGRIVFPTGAHACPSSLQPTRIAARDSIVGTMILSGALGRPETIGRYALPPGTFRMRIMLDGVTDPRTEHPARVRSEWSAAFEVLP